MKTPYHIKETTTDGADAFDQMLAIELALGIALSNDVTTWPIGLVAKWNRAASEGAFEDCATYGDLARAFLAHRAAALPALTLETITHERIAPETHGAAGNGNTYLFSVTYPTSTGEAVSVLSTCERDVAETYARAGAEIPADLAGPYDCFGRPERLQRQRAKIKA